MTGQQQISLPKLSGDARGRVLEIIDMEREMGDSQLATDIEVLLEWHDKFHHIEGRDQIA